MFSFSQALSLLLPRRVLFCVYVGLFFFFFVFFFFFQAEDGIRDHCVTGVQTCALPICVDSGVKKFVFSSTCATYGPPERVPMTEDLPQHPINPYGESKLMFEKILQWFRQLHGLEFVADRKSVV